MSKTQELSEAKKETNDLHEVDLGEVKSGKEEKAKTTTIEEIASKLDNLTEITHGLILSFANTKERLDAIEAKKAEETATEKEAPAAEEPAKVEEPAKAEEPAKVETPAKAEEPAKKAEEPKQRAEMVKLEKREKEEVFTVVPPVTTIAKFALAYRYYDFRKQDYEITPNLWKAKALGDYTPVYVAYDNNGNIDHILSPAELELVP